ncbi:PQQ-binding-like beta-propeller repeat protein [Nocardioides psychrotolerans]|uniref:outer membrane protein assembly factor BamB family protein n=1 Tax=Nocardioides psychrotolerans TaxID=1005945 RepID=UPI003137D84C
MSTEQDTPAVSGCTYCGNAYGPSDVACPSCGFPTPYASVKATVDARRARLRTRVVAGVAAVAVVGGSAFLLLRGGAETPPATTTPAGEAPVEGPRRLVPSWEVALDSPVLGELAVDDAVVLSLDSGDLVSVDAAGEQTWSRAQPVAPVEDVDAGGEVLVSAADGPGISANTLADGEELWQYPDITYVGVAASGFVVDVEAEGGPFGVLDARSGVPTWKVPDVDAYAVAGAMAYVLRGPELTALSADDGSELWTSDVGAGPEATLVANLGLVAVVKGSEVVALDPLNGTERWTARAPGAAVEVLSDALVVVTSERATPPTAIAYDAMGERGELPVEAGLTTELVPFTVDGEAYALDPVSGTVLDEDLTVRATYDGTVTPADDGVYVVTGGVVSHYPLGASTPDAEAEVPGAERAVVLADGFAVVAGDTVTGFL